MLELHTLCCAVCMAVCVLLRNDIAYAYPRLVRLLTYVTQSCSNGYRCCYKLRQGAYADLPCTMQAATAQYNW